MVVDDNIVVSTLPKTYYICTHVSQIMFGSSYPFIKVTTSLESLSEIYNIPTVRWCRGRTGGRPRARCIGGWSAAATPSPSRAARRSRSWSPAAAAPAASWPSSPGSRWTEAWGELNHFDNNVRWYLHRFHNVWRKGLLAVLHIR